ncbi:MAG: hypothetical protein WD184_01710 [Acidimicrobiia bacterium]
MPERVLGLLIRIQVQRDPLKAKGEGYDSGPILAVEEAIIGPPGVIGRHEGSWVMDAHHAAHPNSRAGGRRALSIGFSGHYDLIAERFGSAPLGCAGENLIVATDRRITVSDLEGVVVVRTADGEVPLGGARVATPCREFTSFMLGRPDVAPRDDIADHLAFLEDGMRGYILDMKTLEGAHRVRVGDEVIVR